MSETVQAASVTRFANVAAAYALHRPSYPPEAIAAILADLTPPVKALDVGAGTGIGTRALVAAGAEAVALEPNAEMRAFAIASGLDARSGTATDTNLPDASVDLVAVFQAFHWFANDAATHEFRRVLRPRGRLALVWNERDRNDSFSNALRLIEEQHGEKQMLAGANFSDDTLQPLLEKQGFRNVRLQVFANSQLLDEAGIVGRVRSLSYAPRDEIRLNAFLADVRELYAAYRDAAGNITLRLRTDVYLSEAPG